MNIAVVRGVVNRPAETRTTRNGEILVLVDITVKEEGERAEIVPLVWRSAPAWASELDIDDEVVAVGRVRKRFFQSTTGLQSRTQVEVSRIAKGRQKKALRAFSDLLLEAANELEAA